jgi:capsular polysaccharide biosynthesis protein
MATAASARPLSLPRGAQGTEGGFTLREILAVLRRRLLLIVAVAVCGTALAIGASTRIQRTYEAAAVVAVDSTAPEFERADDQGASRGETAANKIELISSRPLLGQVVDELRLVDDPLFNPPRSQSLGVSIAYLTSLLLPERLVRVGLAANGYEADEPVIDQPLLAREVAIDRLTDRLTVTQPPGAEMLKLTVRANEPAKAADIANAIAVAYVSWEKGYHRQTARDAAGLLQQQLDVLQEDLQKAERTVAEFRSKHGLAAAGLTGGTLNDQRVIDLRNQLVALRGEQIAKQAQLQRARAARSRLGVIGERLFSGTGLVTLRRATQCSALLRPAVPGRWPCMHGPARWRRTGSRRRPACQWPNAVSLYPVTRLARDQGRRHHHAGMAETLELSLQAVAAGADLVTEAQLSPIPGQPRRQLGDGFRSVGEDPQLTDLATPVAVRDRDGDRRLVDVHE